MKLTQFIVLATIGYFGTVHGWLPSISSPCQPDPCENGGSCYRKGISNDYQCTCVGLWKGKNCDVEKQPSPFDGALVKLAALVDATMDSCKRPPFGECSTIGTCCDEKKGIKIARIVRGKLIPKRCEIDCNEDPEECLCGMGSTYRGKKSVTNNGDICENWQGYNESYSIINDILNEEGNHNFCRNPDEDAMGPWCYVDGGDFEYCFSKCTDCVCGNGDNYMGTVNVTKSGAACNTWEQYADISVEIQEMLNLEGIGDHNYCRNPDSDSDPWCFFTNENGDLDVESCYIAKCEAPIY